MPVTTKYVFIVSMDVAPEKEALFNEVYDREHVPNLLKVPGVRSAMRFRTRPPVSRSAGRSSRSPEKGCPDT